MPSILQVALDTPLHRLFDYRLPDNLGSVPPGSLVEVPFGRTRQIGVALCQPTHSDIPADKLREVIRVFDDRPALSPDILRLAQFCADYYHYPLGAILLATLPPRLRNAVPFVAATPWLVLTRAGQAATPAARAKGQHVLLDALRLAPQTREAVRTNKQSRHATALVAAGWAEWSRLPPAAGNSPPTAAAPQATTEQQAALDHLLPKL
ncbi:MAG: primosomal protein N', partial [Thiobacillus sp.]|nr:primosomal protein N' [Thiobacillus sp.]